MKAVFLVNPASANGATGKRWPELHRRARELGLDARAAALRAARAPDRAGARGGRGARAARRRRRRRHAQRGRERRRRPRRRARRAARPAPGRTSEGRTASRPASTRPCAWRSTGTARPGRPRARDLPRRRGRRGRALLRERRLGRDERRRRAAGQLDVEALRRPHHLLLRAGARVRRLEEHRGDGHRSTAPSAAGRCTT